MLSQLNSVEIGVSILISHMELSQSVDIKIQKWYAKDR